MHYEELSLASPPRGNKTRRPKRSVGWLLALKCCRDGALISLCVFLLALMAVLLFRALRAPLRHRPCPDDWITFRKTCYFISGNADSWDRAQSNCSGQGAVLSNVEELEILSPLSQCQKYWTNLAYSQKSLKRPDGTIVVNATAASGSGVCVTFKNYQYVPTSCDHAARWLCKKRPVFN